MITLHFQLLCVLDMVKYRQNADYLYIMIEQLKYDAWLLKGHCHAIWQLFKKLKGVFASVEFQN